MNIGTTIHRMVAASAVAALGLAASAMTTSSYVQDGLVAMWDGNENAGDGHGGHAETLTEWKDTSGRYSFVFNANSGITVEEGALVFPGTDAGYATLSVTATDATFEAARNGTCEVVLRADPSKTTVSIALQSSMESGIALGALARSSADAIAELMTTTGYYGYAYPSYDWFSEVSTLSTTYSSAQPQNTWGNAEKLALSGSNTWGGYDNATHLGFRASKASGQSFKGKIYAIRLYSRQLTAAEIAANRAVDEERFVNGRYGSADLFSISGVPEQFAASEPGYGLHRGYAAGDTEKVKVPAAWTNGQSRTQVAIRLVSAQKADGRWFVGTNDVTSAAVSPQSFSSQAHRVRSASVVVGDWKRSVSETMPAISTPAISRVGRSPAARYIRATSVQVEPTTSAV